MSQTLLRRMQHAAIIGQSPAHPVAPAHLVAATPDEDARPVDAERVRRVLTSIRDCAEWQGIPDHLKLYWISAYINSLLCRMTIDRTAEADEWLAQCHDLAAQMRVVLGEECAL